MNSFYLSRLILTGGEKEYEVKFQPGLNFISGPTATGKTTIFELINYAFGSKSHQDYIEVKEKASDVNLEFMYHASKYKITRQLYNFQKPIVIQRWEEDDNRYEYVGSYSIKTKSEVSFSQFMIELMGLKNTKTANQDLSFRDLFKYSYLAQNEVDNQDILDEGHWELNNKRRNTFEVIFGFYNGLLAKLKADQKALKEENAAAESQTQAIREFLQRAGVKNLRQVTNERINLQQQQENISAQLSEVNSKIKKKTPKTKLLRNQRLLLLNSVNRLRDEQNDQVLYIEKLNILKNQYENDLERYEALITGGQALNHFELTVCPNCFQPLHGHDAEGECQLCGQSTGISNDQVHRLTVQQKALRRKLSELNKFIDENQRKLSSLQVDAVQTSKQLAGVDRQIDQLSSQYTTPFLEQVSLLNIQMGEKNKSIDSLNFNLKLYHELEQLENKLTAQRDKMADISANIKKEKSKSSTRKVSVLDNLNRVFDEALSAFKYPQLSNDKINSENYLPYVRGRKYNDLGSLGGVTLITVAYYLAIFESSLQNSESHHLGFLMIDTPSKNLGVDAKNASVDAEFRDEAIFGAMIDYFVNVSDKMKDQGQLFIINNGYPNSLSSKYIIKEFKPDGSVGLIDDAHA